MSNLALVRDVPRSKPAASGVWLRFYGELNDLLAPAQRGSACWHPRNGSDTIKHVVESLGVPHPEIDLILANGRSVAFGYVPSDGDRISVYPSFRSLDIGPLTRVRATPMGRPRFILDGHLGRLATYLRMLGIDTWYANDVDDADLVVTAVAEGRTVLTRDRGVLKRRAVTHGYLVREHRPRRQLLEVMTRFRLSGTFLAFGRCLRCNTPLEPVAKSAIDHRLEPKTRQFYDKFWLCSACDRVYWRGSHFQRMASFVWHVDRVAVASLARRTPPI